METLCSETSCSHCEVFTMSVRPVVTLVCSQWTMFKVRGRAEVEGGEERGVVA